MGDRDNFQAGIAQQFRQWNTQLEGASQTIADLKGKADQLELSAKRDYLAHIQELENKIAAAEAKTDEGQSSLKQHGKRLKQDVSRPGATWL